MDNLEQITEIEQYKCYLCRILGSDISLDDAARIWIDRYADAWRQQHPVERAAL